MSEAADIVPSEQIANELSFQQETFCLEWLANGNNAKRAAEAAGYAHPDVQGSRLLACNTKVRAFIEAKRAERRAALDIALREKHVTPDALLAMLAEMASFDLGDILDEHGRVDRTKLKAKAKQLQAIEIDGAKTKVKGPDRMRAINLLMDHYGMLKPQQQVNVQVNLDFGERMALRRAKALEGR